jgi:hypothetical protein
MFLLVVELPKETWTGNITTKRNMDRQYNYQKKHGQKIQRPKETWTDNTTTKRVVVLSVHVSFGRCIVCPCFFWSLYFLSMYLLVVVLPVHVSLGQYNDEKKHGQTIQRPKETWTGNTKTNRNMDRQYNDQKKHGQAILNCLSFFDLRLLITSLASFAHCNVCPSIYGF